jgi:hypothetical protein
MLINTIVKYISEVWARGDRNERLQDVRQGGRRTDICEEPEIGKRILLYVGRVGLQCG